MQRAERRMLLLKGRNDSVLPADAIAREKATHARALRRLRTAIRRGESVLVQHTRWPAIDWMLENLAASLAVGPTPVELIIARISEGLRTADGPTILPYVLAELLGVDAQASAAADRTGIRRHMLSIFHEAASGPRRALVIAGADGLRFDTLQDLCSAWRDAETLTRGDDALHVPSLVLLRRVGGASLEFDSAVRVTLTDPGPLEAVAMLAELLGGSDHERLTAIVEAVGTVPAFLHRVAAAGGGLGPVALRQALGPLWRELVQAVTIVRSQEILAARLDALREGPCRKERHIDRQLRRAGLVAYYKVGTTTWVRLRSPLVTLAAGEAT